MDETTGYPTGEAGPRRRARPRTAGGEGGAAAGPVTGAELPRLRAALRDWYAAEGRPLAIRATSEPWAVLLAEVMSQQTRIDRVEPYWRRFLGLFPTPAALAAAPPRDVIRAWSGLGYNRRAVALRDAARAIVDRHGGRVPQSVAELDALPGIGPYTARAIAATAFGVPTAAVDVNVRRVVERLAGGPLAPAEVQRGADELLDPERPDLWTHAVMDLAATVCRRRAPGCDGCPIAAWCRSRGTAGEEPRPRGTGPAFPGTRRWLRGRLLAEVAAADGWHAVEGPRGLHDEVAVREALDGLARDGLVETDGDGRARMRTG